MLYAFISEDKVGTHRLRMEVRPAHLERLKKLQAAGKLVLAGPHPAIDNEDPGDKGFTGSLIVAEFDSLEMAQSCGEKDPYLLEGVYQNLVVKPFKRVLP